MTLSESLERYEAQASTATPRDVAVRRAYMDDALELDRLKLYVEYGVLA